MVNLLHSAFRLVAFLMVLININMTFASHNLAGQITCKYTGTNKYELLLTTYTDPAPAQVDRCSATLEIWNASGVKITEIQDIPRENGPLAPNQPNCNLSNSHLGVPVYQTVKENIYRTQYTFPGPGRFLIRYFDPTRRADIANISNPGDVNFYIETELFITNPLIGINNTPVLLNRPLDEACKGKLWTHNPGGFDADGDSLVYSLVPSQQYDSDNGPYNPIPATGYQFPDASDFGASSFDINPLTGIVTWNTPQMIGVFNFAFVVEEYRNGVLLGKVMRDMVIIVKNCNNDPPVIETITDTCVHANDTLRFAFMAWDPNENDSVYLALNNASIGNNGPFAVNNPAVIALSNPPGGVILPVGLKNDTIKGEVIWVTLCDNIRKTPYQVDFFAHDNLSYIGSAGNAMLTANKAVSIHVIPPAPTQLTVTKSNHTVQLNWNPTECSNAIGYNVYRRLGESIFSQDTVCCDQSPAMAGFQKLTYISGWANTSFVDSLNNPNILFSDKICYLVTAMYGPAFNPDLESCASNLVCISFLTDTLYITNNSVIATDEVNGSIFLSWSKPDTIDPFFTPPYNYQLYRANNNQYPVIPVGTFGLNDTTFTDINLNTEIRGYNYKVELLDSKGMVIPTGSPLKKTSSSIYLSVQADAGVTDLTWKVNPAWVNTEYSIYRSGNGGAVTLIATIVATGTEEYHYQDVGLNPDTRYCYFIRSEGSHNVAGIKPVLINDSNQDCAYPRENTPPCNPIATVSGNCYSYQHTIHIEKQQGSCDDLTVQLQLHYATSFSGPYVPVQTLPYNFLNDTTFTLDYGNNQSYYAGCYAISATNVYGNTSALSSPVCIDYCPEFSLPNVFSPNNDGMHDIFQPIISRAVVLKKIGIYDRWGVLIHQSENDIQNLWDGRMDSNGKEMSFGVYYYVIEYEEQKLAGNESKVMKGWVLLVK
ncbi:MAG: gliding motility-associated C-terminal domain-containing protein [Bacteroidia bacterium]|nr:gliding motility-associated C-terminal domain-containing protein [Bacteroidia bacterium]